MMPKITYISMSKLHKEASEYREYVEHRVRSMSLANKLKSYNAFASLCGARPISGGSADGGVQIEIRIGALAYECYRTLTLKELKKAFD